MRDLPILRRKAATSLRAPERGLAIFYVVSSLEGGGAEYQIPAIVRALAAAGHSVCVLACRRADGMAADRLTREGVPFALLAADDAPRWRSLKRLMALARAERPDLIWTSLPRATLDGQLVGRALGIPVVSWQHSAFTRRYKQWAMPLLHRLSDCWVADSEQVADYLETAMHVPAPRVARWPLFVADRARPQATAWDGTGDFVIGSVGRLSPHKDYPTLLRAFAMLRGLAPALFARCRLRIAGAGPEEAILRSLAAELGIAARVTLAGHLDDPADFLAGLHLYAQPSVMEGMCIAAHEAMAAGLPVIATPVGELRRSVREGRTGRLVPHADPAALARAIEGFAADPADAHAMGLRARAYVLARFSAEGFAARAAEIVAEVAEDLPVRQPVGGIGRIR